MPDTQAAQIAVAEMQKRIVVLWCRNAAKSLGLEAKVQQHFLQW